MNYTRHPNGSIELPNGAHVRKVGDKYHVHAGVDVPGCAPGGLVGMRIKEDEAMALAASLPGKPLPPPPSAPRVELSPSADPDLRAQLNAKPVLEERAEPHFTGGGRTRPRNSRAWEELQKQRREYEKRQAWWAKMNPRLHPSRTPR
jgi:hypothetical protein